MKEPLYSKKILGSKDEIKDYIGGVRGAISDYMFKKYVGYGLPARFDDGRWIAHADNIDEFFRMYTKISMKNILGDVD